jgi:hypothetical protein
MDVMIDIETCGTGVDACILTVAAQCFDPLQRSDLEQQRTFYARVDPESQPDRNISDGTIEWWSRQPAEAQEEAFGLEGRIPLSDCLRELHRLVWHCNRVWANGPTFDCNILEHAYKSYNIVLPWQYYKVRDARTVYGLVPELQKYPASHHALEDCRRQIYLLWDCFDSLRIGTPNTVER